MALIYFLKIYTNCLILRINIKYINVIATILDKFISFRSSFEGQCYERKAYIT
mgnify:CR=1 FL=1